MSCKLVAVQIADYNASNTYIARLRPIGSGSVVDASSSLYKLLTGPLVTFEGIEDGRYEVGISVKIGDTQGPIVWSEVIDNTLPRVTGLSSSSVTGTTATITWSAATGATAYEYRLNKGVWVSQAGLSANLIGLVAGMTYLVEVRMIKNFGVGMSSTTSFQTTYAAGAAYNQVFTMAKECFGGNIKDYRMRYVVGNGLKANGQQYGLYANYGGVTKATLSEITKVSGDTITTLIYKIIAGLTIVPGSLLIGSNYASFDVIDGNVKYNLDGTPILCENASDTGYLSVTHL